MKKIYIMALVLLALFAGNTNSAICMQKNTKQEQTNSFKTKMTAFWQEFRMAVLSGDKDKVVEMTVFPFSIGGDELSKEQFNKYFNVIFNQSLPKTIDKKVFSINPNDASLEVWSEGPSSKVVYTLNFIEIEGKIRFKDIFDTHYSNLAEIEKFYLNEKNQSDLISRNLVPDKNAIYATWELDSQNSIQISGYSKITMKMQGENVEAKYKFLSSKKSNEFLLKVTEVPGISGYIELKLVLSDDKLSLTTSMASVIKGKKQTIGGTGHLNYVRGSGVERMETELRQFYYKIVSSLVSKNHQILNSLMVFPLFHEYDGEREFATENYNEQYSKQLIEEYSDYSKYFEEYGEMLYTNPVEGLEYSKNVKPTDRNTYSSLRISYINGILYIAFSNKNFGRSFSLYFEKINGVYKITGSGGEESC